MSLTGLDCPSKCYPDLYIHNLNNFCEEASFAVEKLFVRSSVCCFFYF